MHKARKLTRFLFGAFGWALVLAGLGLLSVIGIGPHIGKYQTLSVLSGSMRPGIPVGAMVIVTPEAPRDLRVGQIVTYQIPVDDHRVISHRVVKIVEGAGTDNPVFQTKGDANSTPDTWLARVSGPKVWQVRYSVPNAGRLVFWLRRPAVHTGAVRVMPALLAVLWMIGIWRRTSAEPDPVAQESASVPGESVSAAA